MAAARENAISTNTVQHKYSCLRIGDQIKFYMKNIIQIYMFVQGENKIVMEVIGHKKNWKK